MSLKAKTEDFFFQSLPLWPLAVARVVIGLCLTQSVLSLWNEFTMAYGPDAIVSARFFSHIPHAVNYAPFTTSSFSWVASLNSALVFTLLMWVIVFCGITFALGLFTRTSGVLLFFAHGMLQGQFQFSLWGWGELIKPFLLYLTIGGSGTWYSLDAYLRDKAFQPNRKWIGSAWPIRLIQIHVAVLYLVVAWHRLRDPAWLDGSKLYGILTDSVFYRFNIDWSAYYPAIRVVGYSAWALELSAPILLWLKRSRRFVVYMLMGMHVGLELMTRVGCWNFMMIALLCAFLSSGLRFHATPAKRIQ